LDIVVRDVKSLKQLFPKVVHREFHGFLGGFNFDAAEGGKFTLVYALEGL
jgi:hypothetical protein